MGLPGFYSDKLSAAVESVKSESRYRRFLDVGFSVTSFPIGYSSVLDKEFVVWCTNDYLGMSKDPDVIDVCVSCTSHRGVGSGGTRNISGTSAEMVDLELLLADFHSKESSLVFTSGYIANHAVLSTLPKIFPDIVVFSDADNHASIIHGIKDGRCNKHIFRHGDFDHLRSLLSQYDKDVPKLIVFEAIYSMSGDITDIPRMCDLAEEFGALTYVDEVHSAGLYGKHGSGICELQGVGSRVDIIQGNLAKAFGVIGGYIASDSSVVDYIRSYSNDFIFTTALPPSMLAASCCSIKKVRDSSDMRRKHQEVVSKVKSALYSKGIKFHDSSHIIPILINNPVLCEAVYIRLLDMGIYVQGINYPTVPVGRERIRITPVPQHTDEMIKDLADALYVILSDLQVIPKAVS